MSAAAGMRGPGMRGPGMRGPGIRVVVERLTDRVDRLARQLLPGGVRKGNSWRCGSLAGEPGGALRLYLDGPYRGRWRCYKSGAHGDPLGLVRDVMCNGDTRAAYRWALDWLGLGGEVDRETQARLERQAEAARERRRRDGERLALIHATDAKMVWLAGAPIARDDAAWRYFRGRGVDLGRLPEVPRALRLHPALWNPESRRAWPAILAAICAPDGRHVNTHRIWLEPLSDGRVRKAPLERPKLSMAGGYPGGCVRLWKGAGGKPWKDMPDGELVVAGEGIEDTLTIVCAEPAWRYCAVLSVSSLGGLVLPPACTTLVWIGQNDPPFDSAGRPHPARRALAAGLRAHRLAGRATYIIRPPRDLKDVNELAQLAGEPCGAGEFPPFLASGDEEAAVARPVVHPGEIAWPAELMGGGGDGARQTQQ